MANTSASGGLLTPDLVTPPAEGMALDALIQTLVSGVSGLTPSLVRPRWQPTMPKQPAPSTDWCALGVTMVEADVNPALIHDPAANAGAGGDRLLRHEEITVLCSFYGPNGQQNAGLLRDGMYVAQNTEILHLNLIGFVGVSGITTAPELVNEQWIKRYDITMTLRRQVVRTYQVQNILLATELINTTR